MIINDLTPDDHQSEYKPDSVYDGHDISRNVNSHFTEESMQEKREAQPSFFRTILVIDDNPDITFTFKEGLEAEGKSRGGVNMNRDSDVSFQVYTYNDPELALLEFRPKFYDLLIVDIHMPKMNGFELAAKISEIDFNTRVCFMSSNEVLSAFNGATTAGTSLA